MKPTSTREAFGEALVEAGASDPRVVALDGDVATSVMTAEFGKRFPDRYFQLGIAESNIVGVAAGLAMSGKVPFCASFACFITGRFETIRMSVAYNRANVRIVGTHVGVGIGPDGHSQMGLEDVAIMRTLPNMAVIQPATGVETRAATHYLVDHHGPAYLRLTRQKLPELFGDDYEFGFGKGTVLREGSDVAIIGSGAGLHEALGAAEILGSHGISASVANIHTIQPLDDELVASLARSCGRVVTVEDHTVVGGLGGAVTESLSERCPVPVLRIGVRGFGESGDPDELYERFGLSAAKVAASVAGFVQSPAEAGLARH
ncbi:MAG TPA: transketolase C-terminal domain-containing protein [Actinomycetota bacterium]|nr:transketolase C-terminal domain-containing protein [Actinomycetota bacterium]